jgi:predicted nucleotidyltransferase
MMVGVKEGQLAYVMRPEERLEELVKKDGDPLVEAAQEVVDLVIDSSSLRLRDFGVFGSLAHGFHNPRYSDIDLVVYGVEELKELRATLEGLYSGGLLRNEFEDWTPQDPPIHWNFTNYSKEEYGPSQMRKLIYAKYNSEGLGRDVNVEFEPVRNWDEINNEHESTERIEVLGSVEAIGEITSGDEGGFMPSIYPVELKKTNIDMDCDKIRRIVSYVKEFRLQLETGQTAQIKGKLERVETIDGEFHQITMSYGPGYFDQVLRAIEAPS